MSPPSVAKVEAEEVDDEVLLEYERKDLKDDLGLKAGALAKLWKAVEALRGPPPAAAGSPRSPGIAGPLALPAEAGEWLELLQEQAEAWHPRRWVLRREVGRGGSGSVPGRGGVSSAQGHSGTRLAHPRLAHPWCKPPTSLHPFS